MREDLRGVTSRRLLVEALPQVELVGLGHMAPITHPEILNEVVDAIVRRG